MTPEGFQYVFVKEVSDPSTGVKLKLLNPVVLRMRQDQVVLAYPFKYVSAVNGKASEIVVNYENRKNYSGCDDTSSFNPTCGLKYEKGRPIPYSEGFCCLCPEAPVKKKQMRGGQDCSLEVDKSDFRRKKSSAHCLLFSDIWYSVSAVNDPLIIHAVYLQVYNQRHLTNGSAVWVSLTHDEEFELSNKNPSEFDENKTIVASFYTSRPKNGTILISSDENRLLIPQPLPGVPVDKLPLAVKNGASDYLLIQKSVLNPSGSECDTAGVSYDGFARQPDRCDVVKNTCLKNQPLDFWTADNEKRKAGKKGSYLLENYGTPYKDPIMIKKETKEHWLALEYHEKQQSTVTVEFNADQIVVLTPGKHIQISKVITESRENKIMLYVFISNKDLSPASLYVQAVNCDFGVPDSDNQSMLVPPQRTKEYLLNTQPGKIELAEKFFCTVVAGSASYGDVAKRDVIIKPLHRCICNMHCLCACMEESLTCQPMEEEDFHAAGFRGSLPVLTAKPAYRPWLIQHPFLALFAFLLLLLLLGFAKAVFGVMGFQFISHFGLQSRIFDKKRIKHYFEPELENVDVMYDSEGHPVHPDTKQPAKVLSDEIIFALNSMFFCIWPCMKLVDYIAAKKEDDPFRDDTSVDDDDHEPGIYGTDSEKARRWFGDDSEKRMRDPDKEKSQTGESGAKTSSLRSVGLQSHQPEGKDAPLDGQDLVKRRSVGDPFRGSRYEPKKDKGQVPGVKGSKSIAAKQSGPKMKTSNSDNALEVASDLETGVPPISKGLDKWKKGTRKVGACIN